MEDVHQKDPGWRVPRGRVVDDIDVLPVNDGVVDALHFQQYLIEDGVLQVGVEDVLGVKLE